MALSPEEQEAEKQRARIQAAAHHDEARARAWGCAKYPVIGLSILLLLLIAMCVGSFT